MAAADCQDQLLAALEARDYEGALTLLRFSALPAAAAAQWRAFLLFHLGRSEAAAQCYAELAASPAGRAKDFSLHHAACLFHMRRYEEAAALAEQGPECPLRTRLQLHCQARLKGAASLPPPQHQLQQRLGTNVDDRLSLAALLYARNEYEAAAAIYAELLQENPDLQALRVYLALCCYMLDDWGSGAAQLAAYQASHPGSLLAANLLACSEFRSGGPGAAAAVLAAAQGATQGPGDARSRSGGGGGGSDTPQAALTRHNLVVFQDGVGGLQVLPPLVGAVPEARLNLMVWHLRQGDAQRALGMLRGLQPATAYEFICKGVACALYGHQYGSPQHLQQARECYEAVGTSPSERDTVPGRQCAAAAALLGPHPALALPLLLSMAQLCPGDEALAWNTGMAHAAAGEWGAAAEALAAAGAGGSDACPPDPAAAAWLARCHVLGGRPEAAWQLCLAAQAAGGAPGTAQLLQLVAADCYRTGSYLWAARAFDALEFLQQSAAAAAAEVPAAEGGGGGGVWEGKRGACAGVFRAVVEGREDPTALPEVLALLQNSCHPQADLLAGAVRRWQREGGERAAAPLAA